MSVTGEIWSIHTLEYYSALKRKNILTPAAAWAELEDTAQEPGTEGHVLCDPTHRRSPEESALETESRWWVTGAGGGEGRGREWVCNGDSVSVG